MGKQKDSPKLDEVVTKKLWLLVCDCSICALERLIDDIPEPTNAERMQAVGLLVHDYMKRTDTNLKDLLERIDSTPVPEPRRSAVDMAFAKPVEINMSEGPVDGSRVLFDLNRTDVKSVQKSPAYLLFQELRTRIKDDVADTTDSKVALGHLDIAEALYQDEEL